MKYHGIHLLITHCNGITTLTKTLTNLGGSLPKIRSINVLTSASQNKIYPQHIKEGHLLTTKSGPVPVNYITYPSSYQDTTGGQINYAFQHLVNQGRYHVFWMREGEQWVGNYTLPGWLPLDGGLVKIEASGTTHWEIRTMMLVNHTRGQDSPLIQWNVIDKGGVIPTLVEASQDKEKPPSVGKIPGDYLVVTDVAATVVDNFPHPYYFYRNASIQLLKGEVEIARQLFIRARRKHTDNQIQARCYLGQAICVKILEGDGGWRIIKKLLYRSLHISNPPLLEALFLLLQWGLEFEAVEEAWDIVNKFDIAVLTQSKAPETCLLPYDITCYRYLFLATYVKYADILGNYTKGLQVLPVLLNRSNLPLDIRHTSLNYASKFKGILENLKKYEDELAITGINFRPSVSLSVTKSTVVYLHTTSEILTKLRQTALKSSDTATLRYQGLQFIVDKPRILPGYHVLVESQDTSTHLSCYYISAVGELEEYVVKDCPVYLKPTSSSGLSTYLRKRPREFSQRKLAGLLLGDISPSHPVVAGIYQHVTISLAKSPISLERVGDYQNIVVLSSGNYQTDLLVLFHCFQAGCHVLYSGNLQLYLDCYQHFNRYLTDLTGKSGREIAGILNDTSEVIKVREPSPVSHLFDLPNLITKWLKKPPTVRNVGLVNLKDTEICQFQTDHYPFIMASTVEDGLIKLLQVMEDNSLNRGLLHLEGVLSPDNLRIATYLARGNLLDGGSGVDIVKLPHLNLDYWMWNTKLVMSCRQWDWVPLTPVSWKGTLLFRNREVVARCLSVVQGKTTCDNLSQVVRAVSL